MVTLSGFIPWMLLAPEGSWAKVRVLIVFGRRLGHPLVGIPVQYKTCSYYWYYMAQVQYLAIVWLPFLFWFTVQFCFTRSRYVHDTQSPWNFDEWIISNQSYSKKIALQCCCQTKLCFRKNLKVSIFNTSSLLNYRFFGTARTNQPTIKHW